MSVDTSKRIEPMPRANFPQRAWSGAVPVRFRHCDAAGIVFTPRYFDILNEAVERFFPEALSVDYYEVIAGRKIGLGYGHASCEFLRPSRLGDVLEVVVLVERIGTASYVLSLPVFSGGTEVVRGRLVTVTTSLDDYRPRPIPDDIRAALAAYRARCAAPAA